MGGRMPTLAALGLAAAACAGAAQQPVAAAVQARNEALLETVRRQDASAAAAFYTADALLLPPDGTVVRGRAGIRAYWAGGAAFDSVSTAPIAVVARGGLASHTGTYTIWSTGPDGGPRATRGVFLIVWEREADGEWRVQADMWN